MESEAIFSLFDEMIEGQKAKLLQIAKRIIPHVIEDDLLQPNDFPSLESHPIFRYEEGVLHGLQAAKAAFLAEAHIENDHRSQHRIRR
ncbi:MAG: hypothetical protein A3E80_06215 [Chlamydiae bacterium RIFCSPHIGHO2_12_FULL_49_9]|nr:MAG: hypothetical protein A3E80_06215 [Chlamydiae bacterium RIFCSPHIGHO2_12_FULL_49_9]